MAHPSFEQSMHQPSIENGITSNDLASIALKECDKIAKQLASINFRPNCEHGDILDTAEEFLQTQWRLNKFLPVQHLPLTKWFIGLRINFYALCNVTNISCKWFKGKDSHRSPIYPKRIQTLSFAILLSAVSGFREDDLLDMIDETMWKTDSTGVLFMHYLQEDPNRLWYTVLAYKKVEEMRRCSISFNTLFLILMHQLDYKHRELFVLFSLDPVMEEVFSVTMKHIVDKWAGFKVECGQFRRRIRFWAESHRAFVYFASGSGHTATEYFDIYNSRSEAILDVTAEDGTVGVGRNVSNYLKGEFTAKKLSECLRNLGWCLSKASLSYKPLIDLVFTASRLIEKEKKNFADYDHPIPVDETVDNEVPAENDAEPPKKQRKMAAFKDNCGGIFKKSDASGNSSDSSDDSLSSDDSKAGLPSSSHSGSGTVKVHANPFDGVVLTSDEDDDYDDI